MLIMPASKYRGVKRLVQDASPIIESKKQRRSRPSAGGGKAPTNLIPSTSDNLLTTALTLITKGTPGVFTTPKTTFTANSDSEDEEFWTLLPAYKESNTFPTTDQVVESTQSSPKGPKISKCVNSCLQLVELIRKQRFMALVTKMI